MPGCTPASVRVQFPSTSRQPQRDSNWQRTVVARALQPHRCCRGLASLGQCCEIVRVNDLGKEQGVREHGLHDVEGLRVAEARCKFLL